jgi:hypothetical protein
VLFVGQPIAAVAELRALGDAAACSSSPKAKGRSSTAASSIRAVAAARALEVALDNAERRGLKLSSRLLTVAHFGRGWRPQ